MLQILDLNFVACALKQYHKLSSLSLFDILYDFSRRFSAKCVFFICVLIHKSEEHNSESTNNYSGEKKGVLKPPWVADG